MKQKSHQLPSDSRPQSRTCSLRRVCRAHGRPRGRRWLFSSVSGDCPADWSILSASTPAGEAAGVGIVPAGGLSHLSARGGRWVGRRKGTRFGELSGSVEEQEEICAEAACLIKVSGQSIRADRKSTQRLCCICVGGLV